MRAETPVPLEMVDRNIGLTGEQPQKGTPKPPVGKTGPRDERSIHQAYGGIDVLAKIAEQISAAGEEVRVVCRDSQRAPRQIQPRVTVRLPVIRPAVEIELGMAMRRQSESVTITGIALNRSS